jgi:hypothetical protein
MLPGMAECQTPDHVRPGTTCLFPALGMAAGVVIGKVHKRQRPRGFRDLFKEIDTKILDDLNIPIVMDNYASRRTKEFKACLTRCPDSHAHSTSTSAYWIIQNEQWIAELARMRLQHGIQTFAKNLTPDLQDFIGKQNENRLLRKMD